MFFSFFLQLSTSKCKYSINVGDNNPMTYNFNLDENEFICINSTLPYLTILLEPTQVLRINAYKNTNSGLEYLKTTYSPVIYSGFDFSNEIGSMDIETILPGFISISLFAFPKECKNLRYVTNLDSDYFTLNTKFENFQPNTTICMWYGSLHYIFKGKFLDGSSPTNEILVCYPNDPNLPYNKYNFDQSEYFCKEYLDYRSLPRIKNIFFKVTPRSDHFIQNYLFRFNSSYVVKHSVHVANVLYENNWSEIEIEESNLIQVSSRNNRNLLNNKNNVNKIIDFNDSATGLLLILFTVLLIILASLSIFIFIHFCIKNPNSSRNNENDESIPILSQQYATPPVFYIPNNNNNNGNAIFSRFYSPQYFQSSDQQQYYYNPQFFDYSRPYFQPTNPE